RRPVTRAFRNRSTSQMNFLVELGTPPSAGYRSQSGSRCMGSSYGASNSMWRNRYVTETSRAASFAEHNELDCTTTPNGDDSRTEHLVALGASPADSLLHASSADNE